MIISADTKISQIIRHNAEAIEAIASINPHFRKLRNPVLRKLLASRVTVKDAARIGHCKPEDFFRKLIPLGFQVEHKNQEIMDAMEASTTFTVDPARLVTLDVRPILSKGDDPFHQILTALGNLPAGGTLKLINSFEPVPLLKILSCKGYLYFVKHSGDQIDTFITAGSEGADALDVEKETLSGFDAALSRFKTRLDEIDVSRLEMPEPMHRILNRLEELREGFALLVHHRKVPHFLFPELAERDFQYSYRESNPGVVEILIWKHAGDQ